MAVPGRTKSLVDELAELVNPAPKSFELEDITFDSAKLVENKVDDDIQDFEVDIPSKLQIRAASSLAQFKTDPRYSGKVVSRKKITQNVEFEDDSSDDEAVVDMDMKEHFNEIFENEDDQSNSSSVADDNSDVDDDQLNNGDEEVESSDNEDDPARSEILRQEGLLVTTPLSEDTPLVVAGRNIREEVEKGEAVKKQLSLWDDIVEGRIRLQKLLPLCNRLPQGENMAVFKTTGGDKLNEGLSQCESELSSLLDELLELKELLLQKNEGILGGREQVSTPGASSFHGNDDDEEIDSDIADGIESDHNSDGESDGSDNNIHSPVHTRKRPNRSWCLPKGKRCYEDYVSKLHQSFERYRDDTITKWNTRAQLTSGKVSNKSFLQVDQSVLGQIKHVLGDKQRLVKRTQLKRSSFHVLGNPSQSPVGVSSANVGHDVHLRTYDEEIFDDSDFYHQLLRDVIERKMNYTDITDPVAMGRQWVALQKLRTKVKKDVDTRASKARKIRFDVHPKLVGFMAPVEVNGEYTDSSKNDLFSSLFGQSCQN